MVFKGDTVAGLCSLLSQALKTTRDNLARLGWLLDLLLGADQVADTLFVLLRQLELSVRLVADQYIDLLMLDKSAVLSQPQDALNDLKGEDKRLIPLVNHLK